MKDSRADICEWLALSMVSGLGNVGFKQLLKVFGSPSAVLEAKEADLQHYGGIRKDVALRITSKIFTADPDLEYMRAQKAGARIVTYNDPGYPPALKEIPDPPMLFYIRGQPMPSDKPLVAVVGSRSPTSYGIKSAQEIAEGLAAEGVGVVSGLATGIDSAAHNGCLKARGFTVAVMGTGIDIIYPASNRYLFERIAEEGCIVTEFPTGTPPEGKNFPKRNRIISGLAMGVVVVEAAKKSGSLITAAMALEQGREVFAVPGSIQSSKSAGTHFLLKHGAALVEKADDIIAALGIGKGKIYNSNGRALTELEADLGEDEKIMLDILEPYPIHIDSIIQKVDMEPGRVLAILLQMELKGMVTQLSGKMFIRTGR
ncbi:MAG: DNA-protecting protein DprA [Desulfobacteraceae bacterium]|jgi:DNA processing protein|nr:MAG: DNA-protecting protein DprA [Desulfobacteraceae bacterium]